MCSSDLFKVVLPSVELKAKATACANKVMWLWATVNAGILAVSNRVDWDVQGGEALHQSPLDTLPFGQWHDAGNDVIRPFPIDIGAFGINSEGYTHGLDGQLCRLSASLYFIHAETFQIADQFARASPGLEPWCQQLVVASINEVRGQVQISSSADSRFGKAIDKPAPKY